MTSGGHAAAVVGRIYDRLVARYGEESVFTDVDTIPPGVRFDDYIDRAVGKTDVLLAVVGPGWLDLLRSRAGKEQDFHRLESEAALDRSIPVVPLLVGDARMPEGTDLPPSLARFALHNAFAVDTERDFNTNLTRLVHELDRLIGAGAGGVGPSSAPDALSGGKEMTLFLGR